MIEMTKLDLSSKYEIVAPWEAEIFNVLDVKYMQTYNTSQVTKDWICTLLELWSEPKRLRLTNNKYLQWES